MKGSDGRSATRLNVGCGTDYRKGYVNVDGNPSLRRVDVLMDVTLESLLGYFGRGSLDEVLCNDFLEHHFHHEAVALLHAFAALLKPGGRLSVRVPDAALIVQSDRPAEAKLRLLFGGQDEPCGVPEVDAARITHPRYFCHLHGWTEARLVRDLSAAGFRVDSLQTVGTNLVASAVRLP